MRLDLHLHSTCSDGALAPAAVVAAAQRGGLGMIALADHDTGAGIAPARAAAAALGGVGVLAAMELTCRRGDAELHLLGYGFRPGDPELAALVAAGAAARRERMLAMVERLRTLGVELDPSAVTGEAGCVSIGRMHLARALVRHRRAGSVADAFARYIGDGGPAWVPSGGPAVADAIAAVAGAGGVAVWAHPSLEDAGHVPALAEQGLGGVEALRPSLDPHTSVVLEQAARAAGLVVTGGSDWHGAPHPALGAWYVTERHVGPFLERLGVVVP